MKILDNGIAVLDFDSHISKWIEEEDRIDHDLTVALHIIPMFQPDWWVIDVGADVGSHTVRYADAAARVIAFEPNPDEFSCLAYNCRNLPNVTCLPVALSALRDLMSLVKCENAGASHLIANPGPIMCMPLDSFPMKRLDFLKIDVEGCELQVLEGAKNTIHRHRPLILMEMNAGALERYGANYRIIFEWLGRFGYTWRSFPNQDVDLMNEPQYDLLATPKAIPTYNPS